MIDEIIKKGWSVSLSLLFYTTHPMTASHRMCKKIKLSVHFFENPGFNFIY